MHHRENRDLDPVGEFQGDHAIVEVCFSARDWPPAQRVPFLEREKDARDWLEVPKAEIRPLLEETPEAAPAYGLRLGRTLETITDR